jgi:chaperonin GroES
VFTGLPISGDPSFLGNKMRKLQATHGNVILRRVEAKAQTAGGIILPEFSQEIESIGKIVSVSSLCDPSDLEFKRGDTVVFKRHAETDICIDEQKYIIVKIEDILGVLVEDVGDVA